jgi:hypothetical protein
MRILDPTLRQIGKRLQTEGEATVQTPMPWDFLELLCQLDEKEEALANEASDKAEEERNSESAPVVRPKSAS